MAEDNGLGWGKSLPVPSVQEMVWNDPQTVPDRYVRDHKDKPIIDEQPPYSSDIPVIDFSLLSQRDADEIKKLDFACKEWGFFQLVNHGVAEELIYKMKESGKGFFDLPYEEKKKYAQAENDIQGYGQGFVVSEEQKLDWADLIFLIAYPPEQRKFKLWPLSVSEFKEALEKYSTETCKVFEEIIANLSLLMGMQEDRLKELHQGLKLGARMNYYPPCSKPDLVLGLSPHSDGGSITLLIQDDDLTALQIKHEGAWLPVKPMPGAFVVNVGDAMEVWSNGAYKSIEHRAVTNATKARISIAMFAIPDDQAEIGPLETMVNDQPVLYKKFTYVDYLRSYFDRKLDGKNTEIIKLERQ